jgi:serine acetyltransferase
MSNQSSETTKQNEYSAAVKDIVTIRRPYVLEENGWLEAAIRYDPALDKYISEDLRTKIRNPKSELTDFDAELKIEANKIREDLRQEPLKQMELFSYPGLTAMAAHQAANELYKSAMNSETDEFKKLADLASARRISEAAKSMSGIDIHPGADIAADFFIDHGTGVVIGETAIIGKHGFSLHGNTFGGGNKKELENGIERRHPKLGDNISIGSNSNIYGACNIGDNISLSTGVNIIDSDIKDNTKIGAGTRVTGSHVGKNVVIYPEAQVFNCVIGEGARIGAGIRIENVTIPPYAEVHDLQTPKIVIYTDKAEHHGKIVTAKDKDVELREDFINNGNNKKAIRAAEYMDFEQLNKVENWQDMLGIFAAQKAKEKAQENSPTR